MYLTGGNDGKHLKVLENVLQRCEESNLTLKQEKCEFMQETVDFIGNKLNKEGLSPQEDKIEAIHKAPEPINVHELKSYLGLVIY